MAKVSSRRDVSGVGDSGEEARLVPGEQFEASLPEVLVAKGWESLEVRGGGRRCSSFDFLCVLEFEADQLVGGGVTIGAVARSNWIVVKLCPSSVRATRGSSRGRCESGGRRLKYK